VSMTLAAQEALAKDPELYKKRHSLAHIMAEAVRQAIPEAQIAIGPPIETGFYYDFELPRSLNETDFGMIEGRMRQIIASKAVFEKRVLSRDDALVFFKDQKFKVDLIQRLPENEEISIFHSHDFDDLCRGPHVADMSEIDPQSFKLSRVAGAYWRGDEKNPMLQRIYAYAFNNKSELDEYLAFLEDAERRDHRRIGKELDLFHLDAENPGQIFWHPNGWTIWRTIEDYIRGKIRAAGYVEVKTPSVMPQSLWERSGHWAKYRENMFVTESEKRLFALKPMNCPGHIEIFKQGIKSYRDLPMRIAEFGSCTRNEASGALHGIMRIRGFVQDDAHIFCTEEQIESEVRDFCTLLSEVYRDFGFDMDRILVRLALRPELRLGDDATWERAETALGRACNAAGFQYVEAPGEGAFYGPKLEFTLIDALGRKWQCGTIQLDYQLPSADRLNAEYTGEDGARHHPVMLHRAILGSLERFIGILIEQYTGTFPVWLAPQQAIVIAVSEKFNAYATKVADALKAAGYRAQTDLSDQKMGAKIRLAQKQRIPYMLIVGGQEEESQTVSVRTLSGEQKNAVALSDFIALVAQKIAEKAFS